MRISQLVVKVFNPKDVDSPFTLVLIILLAQMVVFSTKVTSIYCNNLFECHSYVFLTNNITIHSLSYVFDSFYYLSSSLFETDF